MPLCVCVEGGGGVGRWGRWGSGGESMQPCKLQCHPLKSLNETENPTVFLPCVCCFLEKYLYISIDFSVAGVKCRVAVPVLHHSAVFVFIFIGSIRYIRVSWKVEFRVKPIMKTRLFKYIENFTTQNWKFSDKNLIFFIFLLKTYIVGTR